MRTPPQNVPVLDREQLTMILSIDDQQPDGAALPLVDLFDKEATAAVGRLAVAVDVGDSTAIAHEAHSLKGAAALFALPRLALAAAEFEQTAVAGAPSAIRKMVHQLRLELAEGIAALRAAVAAEPTT